MRKLDILDNTTAVCTTSEKELFFELLEKHKTRQEPHWSRMLGEYNRIATDSLGQGQYDIRWKTVPLLKQFARDSRCANSVARSNRRLALLQDQSDAAAVQLHGPSVAVLAQQSHGPAPHCAPALDNSQEGIAKRLPQTLTQKERAYLLSEHRPQPPWGNAPLLQPPKAPGRGAPGCGRKCLYCSEKVTRFIPLVKNRHSQKDGHALCKSFLHDVEMWKQWFTIRGQAYSLQPAQ